MQTPPAEGRSPAVRVVVAASTSGHLSLSSELHLIKAALLYSDKATLISPVSTGLVSAAELANYNEVQKMSLLAEVLPDLVAENVSEILTGIDRCLTLLKKRRRTTQELQLLGRLRTQLRPYWAEVINVAENVGQAAGAAELERAIREGVLEVETIGRSGGEFIASSVRLAARRQAGRSEDDPHTDELVNAFVSRIGELLTEGLAYPIFDEDVAGIAEAAVRVGAFQPAEGPRSRSRQVGAASDFLSRLPSFPSATVGEILDIRNELRAPLIRFRSALADVTSSFSNDSFTQAFKDEVQEAWVKTVEPALLEIRELIRDNRYLRALWEQVVMPPTGLASLAGLVVGVTKLHGIPEFLAVGTAAALPSVRAAWTHTAAQRQAERNQFYFLYRAEQALAYKSAT